MSINNSILKNDLKGKYIFLSASIPSADRDEIYYIETNPLDITDFIVTLTRSILNRSGKIVFGGHPTISPLILSVAKDFISYFNQEDFPLIYIYQTRFFKDKISKFTKELLELGIGIIKWTIANQDREKSLLYMRKKMIKEIPLNAAIFIGGMEGIKEEYSLFTKIHPNSPIYPIATTGGATKIIFEEDFLNQTVWRFLWKYDVENLIKNLNNSKEYPYLVKQILSDIKSKPIYILIYYGKRFDYHSNKAWLFVKSFEIKKEYEVVYDKNIWEKSEITSKIEMDKKEREMVKKADIIVRLIHPPSKSGEQWHEGAQREYIKAMRAGKPIIEIYYMGAKPSSNQLIQESSYKYRIPIYLKKGEHLKKGINRGLEVYRKIKESELYNPSKDLVMT